MRTIMADTLGPQIGPIPLKMFKNQLLDFFYYFLRENWNFEAVWQNQS